MNITGLKPTGLAAIVGSLFLISCTATTDPPSSSPQSEPITTVTTPDPPSSQTDGAPSYTDEAAAMEEEISTDEAPVSESPITIRAGSFIGGEHPTSGGVRILQQEGKAIVELGGDFQTRKGPDLKVILHRASNVLGSTTPPDFPIQAGDYVVLDALKSTTGAQTYAVPEQVDVEEYNAVAIWCQTYNATFGAAQLI